MERIRLMLGIILSVVMVGCKGERQSAANLLTVDVNANYPEKELILQDFMDVEYVPLETTDEFITQGVVEAIGNNIIVVRNRMKDGNIFIFDRNGKGLRRINRLGQSGEEYSNIPGVVLDEDNNEMFVIDYPSRKILVYDLYGNFNRSFKFAGTSYYIDIFNYDSDHLICYKSYSPTVESEQSGHVLIAKKDGSITKEFNIPIKEIETPIVTKDGMVVTPGFSQTAPYSNGWLFTRASSNTIYRHLSNGDLVPLIIRTPSIHSMDSKLFLFPTVVTDRYYFMRILSKEFDFEKLKEFSTTDLVYDTQENAIFEYRVCNNDFSNKRQVSFGTKLLNQDVLFCQAFNASDLIEANEKGELKGKLEEMAGRLNEDSNPVLMMATLK